MKEVIAGSHLCFNERVFIEAAIFTHDIHSYRGIVCFLEQHFKLRHALNSIHQEISRNGGIKKYRAEKAQKRAQRRRYKKVWREDEDQDFRKALMEMLSKRTPVKEISERLQEQGFQVSIYSVYAYIKRNQLRKMLPRKGRKRATKPRKSKRMREGYKLIRKRPASDTIGHLELDTVVSKGRRDSILSIVDRKTRMYECYHLEPRSNQEVARLVKRYCQEHKIELQSINCDLGVEFTSWEYLERTLKVPAYYADPGKLWQRGMNERFNGALRRYFPKGSYIKEVSPKELKKVCKWIQSFRLDVLGRRSPKEILEHELLVRVQIKLCMYVFLLSRGSDKD